MIHLHDDDDDDHHDRRRRRRIPVIIGVVILINIVSTDDDSDENGEKDNDVIIGTNSVYLLYSAHSMCHQSTSEYKRENGGHHRLQCLQ